MFYFAYGSNMDPKDGRVVSVGDQWFDKAVMDSSCKSGSCGC